MKKDRDIKGIKTCAAKPILYVSHSTRIDYKKFYSVIKRDKQLNKQYDIILPHDTDKYIDFKSIARYVKVMVVIGENLNNAPGSCIEIGMAFMLDKPIYMLTTEKEEFGRSLKHVCTGFLQYNNLQEIPLLLKDLIKEDTNEEKEVHNRNTTKWKTD